MLNVCRYVEVGRQLEWRGLTMKGGELVQDAWVADDFHGCPQEWVLPGERGLLALASDTGLVLSSSRRQHVGVLSCQGCVYVPKGEAPEGTTREAFDAEH